MPKITFLVTVFDRPQCLWASLGSLIQQNMDDWEAIVLDNGDRSLEVCSVIAKLSDKRIGYLPSASNIQGWDDYWAAEFAVNLGLVKGDYICCASDDSYYVPEFAKLMTSEADKNDWDLTYCNVLYDPRAVLYRSVMKSSPSCGHIDKTCFIVKYDKWIGFPTKNTGPYRPTMADGEAVEEMVRRGYRHGLVDQILVVHN